MRIATYTDGRDIEFDEGGQVFSMSGVPIDRTYVSGYDRAGQLAWVSEEMRDWFNRYSSAVDAGPVQTTAPVYAGSPVVSGTDPGSRKKLILIAVAAILFVFFACCVVSLIASGGDASRTESAGSADDYAIPESNAGVQSPGEVTGDLQTDPVAEPPASNAGLPIANLTDKDSASDKATRAAVLDAAHKGSGIADAKYYVWQLHVQGTVAVADLQGPGSAKRQLVVLEKTGGQWTVVKSVKYIDATEGDITAATPAATGEIASKVDLMVPIAIDSYFTKYRSGIKTLFSQGAPSHLYAPTRVPEGFVVAQRNAPEGSASIDYSDGSATIIYYIWISGDYGETVPPEQTFTNLKFGQDKASMDPSYMWETATTGPILTGGNGHQMMVGIGATPGQLAAMAESMKRLD